jgi:hypothetical protein
MLCSYIPGRLRLRLSAPPAGVPENPDVSDWPGVKKLTANPKTGSFLLEYDPEVLDLETIAEFIDIYDPEAAQELHNIANGGSRYPKSKPTSATAELINMFTALLASVVTGFFGPKKYHVQAGLFFTGLALVHSWRYRHRIKAFKKWTLHDFLGLPDPPVEEEPFEDDDYPDDYPADEAAGPAAVDAIAEQAPKEVDIKEVKPLKISAKSAKKAGKGKSA